MFCISKAKLDIENTKLSFEGASQWAEGQREVPEGAAQPLAGEQEEAAWWGDETVPGNAPPATTLQPVTQEARGH